MDDSADKSIGVQESTTEIYISDEFQRLMFSGTAGGSVQALIQGKVSAVVIDSEPAKVFVNQNEGLNILPEAYTTEEYAIAVSKRTEPCWITQYCSGRATEDGTIQRIIDKYISAD